MQDDRIQLLATATCSAGTSITSPRLAALQDSLSQACVISARSNWDCKAAAYAEFFNVLADAADDPRAAQVLNNGARFAYNLMIAVGRAADYIVFNSRKRVLAYLRAGDFDEAGLEMEKHIRTLQFMWRLANGSTGHAPELARPASGSWKPNDSPAHRSGNS
jgi:DNA-binding GntR family transcriptional regulator